MVKLVYGMVIIGVIAVAGVFAYTNLPPSSRPEVNMRQKIKDELNFEGSILERDWSVWSEIARDSGMIFTKMDTWEQFMESHRQGIGSIVIMLDEENRVVWYKAYVNHAIYYEY